MKNPQDIIQLAIIHREFVVVASHQLVTDGVNIIVDVQGFDFRARCHQIVDLDLF